MINKTAGCFCGEHKFNVLLDEKPRVFNCHCIDCRKKIGGIISIIQLRENAVDIDKSKLGTYEHSGGSGNKFKKYYLYAGLLDDISFLKKAENIHFKESHFPFLQIKDDDIKI